MSTVFTIPRATPLPSGLCLSTFPLAQVQNLPIVDSVGCCPIRSQWTSMGWVSGKTEMSDLKWTTKKPTKIGWYWYRGECNGKTVKVLHFIDDDGEGPYLATSDDVALNDLGGEWAGPVEPPLSGQSR